MNIYTLPGGSTLRGPQAFELAGIAYPRNWLELASADEIAERGITVAPESVPPPAPPSATDITRERNRRLALGFDHDFQDARGVHHIGTTPDDMAGWREVIDYANALIDLGDTDTLITIVTDTGPARVTAPEWQAVMLRAAEVRQSIWAKSFALQALSPIPNDFADDSRWT